MIAANLTLATTFTQKIRQKLRGSLRPHLRLCLFSGLEYIFLDRFYAVCSVAIIALAVSNGTFSAPHASLWYRFLIAVSFLGQHGP
jgi:hypothetical protein